MKCLPIVALALTLPLAGVRAATFTTNATIAAGEVTYDGQPIVVSNCTLTVNGPHSFASLLLTNGAVLTHSPAPSGEISNWLNLAITGDLTVDASSRIDASANGFAAQFGPGAGAQSGGGWGSGAGHGGVGGAAYNYGMSGGGAYDLITEPSLWGSGGGTAAGGPGGGMVKLTVAGVFRLNGGLKADGSAYRDCCGNAGGGSGGSIWAVAGTITGAGSISARGGAGIAAGGGGGGRIAVYFTQNTFTGTITATGAAGFQTGGAGTIFTKASAASAGTLLVDNGGALGEWTPVTAPEAFNLAIANNAKVTALASLTLSSLLVQTNGTLSCLATLSNLALTVSGDLAIDAGGKVDVSGLGYPTEQGPGAGARDGGGWGAGAGHGGVGGYSNYGKPGGGAYDSILTPTLWGSGGGGGGGAKGGGALLLNVGGSLRVDGVLTADGASPWNPQQGGGAGGSILANVGTVTGSGSITARGGTGGVTQGGGGGGGGRIALYFSQNNFAGTLTAAGGPGYQNGGAGTVYTKASTASVGTLVVDNSGNSGEWTPLTAPESCAMIVANAAKASALAPLTLSSLVVRTNSTLSCPATASNLALTVSGDFGIDAGGKVDVSGLGYPKEQGPGAGVRDGGGWGSGAAHGGNGGYSYYGQPGGSGYGSILTPTQWGSGGGSAAGGSGGGAMALTVGGTLRVDGALTADGIASGSYSQHGGGAGGSVWINAVTLTGSGLISTRGGVGGVTMGGGGGGGGRIALYFTQNTFAGIVTAVGGAGYQNGGAGTIFTKASAASTGLVLVDNGTNAGLTRLNSTNWASGTVFDLTITGASIVKPDAPETFGNLILSGSAVVTHDAGQSGFSWTCQGNATIGGSASFNVDGFGYGPGGGIGHGGVSGYGYGSGAGHGGRGADGYNGGSSYAYGGTTYGSSNAPITLGSGGGANSGGAGGGAIQLTVAGSLQLDGTMTANGLAGAINCGSGSGGSLWITADTLSGAGTLSAQGGPTSSYGAGGGGGRIAIIARDRAGFTGSVSVTGSSPGTIYYGVPPTPPPVITSSGSATGQVALAFSYQITASNYPTLFGATGLPGGLTVNTNTGLISGTPTAPGNFSAQIMAANSAGSNTAPLNIVISRAAPASVVAYYRFEEGVANTAATAANSILDSAGVVPGSPSGGPVYRTNVATAAIPQTGASNRLCLQFSGGQALTFNTPFLMHSNTDATLEFYMKVPKQTIRSMLWTRTDSADYNRFNMELWTDGRLYIDYREPGGAAHYVGGSGVDYPSDTWCHIAVTRKVNTNGTHTYRMYLNGAKQSETVDTPVLPNNTGWTISGRGGEQFSGYLDEVRISAATLEPWQFLNGSGVAPTAIQLWLASYGLTGTNADYTADPDRDRLSNIFEYAFNTNPTNAASVFFPTASLNASYAAITYRERTGGTGTVGVDYTAGGLTYTVQVASELGGAWQSGSSLVELVPGSRVDNGNGTETVSVRLKQPVAQTTVKFMRLVLTPSP